MIIPSQHQYELWILFIKTNKNKFEIWDGFYLNISWRIKEKLFCKEMGRKAKIRVRTQY